MKQKFLLAVYGILKKGFPNHSLLRDGKLLGTTETEPVYTMYSMYGFPAITKGGDTSIEIEVYEVDNRTRQQIYALEGYSGKRDNPDNAYDTLDIDTPWGKAEMFYITRELDRPIIDTGNWQIGALDE